MSISGASNITCCLSCDVEGGEYANPGSGYCQMCPQYEFFCNNTLTQCNCLPTFNRDEDDKCTCSADMNLDGEECVLCKKAKFKGALGVESCALCEDLLKGSTTNSSCICPIGTFDNLKEEDRRCEVIDEGASKSVEGMTLEPGFRRTDEVRVCEERKTKRCE